jgi:molybdate transport system ATP-binding protein
MTPATIHARFHLARPDFCLDVDLTLPGQGITALFGHSGSGKTTCLRCMAGLERASGHFRIGDQIWQDDAQQRFLPTHQRSQGYVFQEASLFPHLDVRANLAFGQGRANTAQDKHAARQQLESSAELLGIAHLLKRQPVSLSGGERQRVAIARALLTAPQLLLMDEPLAALDLKRKQEILPYLERLHDELSIPIIYVSHAPDEVARLADHLVLLDGGKVVASGPLHETLGRADLPPAFADDAGVVLDTRLVAHEAEDSLSRLELCTRGSEGGEHACIYVALRPEPIGQRLRCRIHARDVSLSRQRPEGSSILNILPATIEAIAPTDTPGHVLVQLKSGNHPLLARITERSRRQLDLAVGQTLWAQVKAVALLA